MRFFFLFSLLFSLFLSASQMTLVKTEGVVCAFCAKGIKKHFSKISGVEEVKVDIDSGDVSFIERREKNLTEKEIEEIIQRAGFKVVGIIRKTKN